MPKSRPPYPPEFRREAVAMVRSGRTVPEVAESARGVRAVAAQLGQARSARPARARRWADAALSARSCGRCAGRTRGSSRSVTCSNEPRPSSQRRPSAGERLPDDLGGEGPDPGLRACRAARCQPLWLSTSGARPPSDRALSDAWLIEKITEIHKANRSVYGAPRIHAELRLAARDPGRPQARGAPDAPGRICRAWSPSKRGRTTISVPGVRVADDLVERQFRPAAPNVLWVADITYLRTWEGWLYLAAVQDAYSRGSSAGRWPTTCAQSSSSTRCRWPSPPPARARAHSPLRPGRPIRLSGLRPAARDAGIARSMGSKGDCFDNAVAESFFATLKKELVHRRSWPTRRELIGEVFEYIEAFYNRRRRHSTLGMLSPWSSRKDLSALRCQTLADTTTSTTNNYPVARKRSPVHRSGELQTADLASFTLSRKRPWMNSVRLTITRCPARSLRTYTFASSA